MITVTPIFKWFVLYNKNIVLSDKVEFLRENQIKFHLSSKDAVFISGKMWTEKTMENVTLEGWTSMDLLWEDKHYGVWQRTYLQEFPELTVTENKDCYVDGKRTYILTCAYKDTNTYTKFDNEGNPKKKKDWSYDKKIDLKVHYDPYTSKPVQSILTADQREKND